MSSHLIVDDVQDEVDKKDDLLLVRAEERTVQTAGHGVEHHQVLPAPHHRASRLLGLNRGDEKSVYARIFNSHESDTLYFG